MKEDQDKLRARKKFENLNKQLNQLSWRQKGEK